MKFTEMKKDSVCDYLWLGFALIGSGAGSALAAGWLGFPILGMGQDGAREGGKEGGAACLPLNAQ